MVIYLDVNKDGTLEGWSKAPTNEDSIEIEILEDHPVLSAFGQYKYIEGELIKMTEEEINSIYNRPTPPTDKERIEELENIILHLLMRR